MYMYMYSTLYVSVTKILSGTSSVQMMFRVKMRMVSLDKYTVRYIVLNPVHFLLQRRDNTYRDFFSNLPEPPNAIYTHKYSPSKSKMLLAGGPLPLGLYGNYCSLWA